jgi:DNA-binding NtrC family response regulator
VQSLVVVPGSIIPTDEARDGRRPTILVLADQENCRDLLADIFEMYQCRVVPCDSVREVAAAALREPGDLVVMELDRPAHGQADTLRLLRRTQPKLKIVAILGDPSLAFLEPLVDIIVWKPFSVDDLAAIAGLIDRAESSEKSS